MFVKQFVDEGLGNSSYLVGSEASGLAAVIDPLRDVDRYVQLAAGLGLCLAYALDTHLHADFISGARELAAQVGVQIGASAAAELAFDHLPLREGDNLSLGDATIGVLQTPGHTPEHISFTVSASAHAAPAALFSGGALIVGGAARTDLIAQDLTVPLARQLFHSIHDKLLRLPDSVTVYPTHGAGSFCAAPATSERVTTIGRERTRNPLAQAHQEDDFVALALRNLPSYPLYYRELRPVNQRGARVLGGLPQLAPLSAAEVHAEMTARAAVLDVRPARAFAEGHIPGSYGIAVEAPLITWAGWLIPFRTPLLLVSEDASDRTEAVRQLIRIGYDELWGFLEGGLAGWEAAGLPLERFTTMSAAELHQRLGDGQAPLVLDVRQNGEWLAGHIPGATHIENGRLPYDYLPLPVDGPVAVHCHGCDRSTAGASVLARRGYRNLILISDGFAGWAAAGFEIERGSGGPM